MPPRTSTGKISATQQDAILKASNSNYLGLFWIQLEQIEPHPFQRAICNDWVVELKQHFVDHGLDKAAHPVKVLLHGAEAVTPASHMEDKDSAAQLAGKQWVGEELCFQVFDGQHWLAACATKDREEDKWWFGKVYRQGLEHKHPAEFLSMIHAGNEAEIRQEGQDAD